MNPSAPDTARDDDAESSYSGSSSSSSSSPSLAPPLLDESFLPRILALFFAIFHPTQGPKVVYQVPEGSVTSDEVGDVKGKGKWAPKDPSLRNGGSSHLQQEQLFDFDTLSDYLIPKAPLCGRLITCTTKGLPSANDRTPRHYKVLSYPVLIEDSDKYERNTFIFNLAFVFDGKADVKSYEPVVRKCARALQGLEQSSSFLSSTLNQPRMYGIVEHLYQDLNSYCEVFVDLPEAPHTSYEKAQRNLALDAISPSFRGHTSSAMLTSPSQSSALRATRGLAAIADGAMHAAKKPTSLIDSRRGSAVSATSSGSRHGSPAVGAAADPPGLPFGMSPIEEAGRSGSHRRGSVGGLPYQHTMSPLSALTATSMTSPSPAPFTALGAPAVDPLDDAASQTSRRSSGASEAHRRPSMKRSKTTSTTAVNEAKANAVSVGMRRALSNTSTSSSSSDDAMVRRHTASTSHQRDSSYDAIAAELSTSLASLRNTKNTDPAQDSTDDPLSSILPQPPTRAPGQREPPHGLGRTVREAINLKLFPTYANPPPVHDWDVPVSLLDLGHKTRSSNWDLTMAAVYPYINGINHVKRIAQLADADLELTRQCMEHLLYYGCILTVDVFQFFNVYTVKPAIARMADDEGIQAECGPYVTRPGHSVPAWPTLLALYTALRPGVLLERWIEERQVEALGIDVRRFVTFGIIKGFLRRVHRYPVLLGGPAVLEKLIETARSRSQSRSREREMSAGGGGASSSSPFAPPSVDASRDEAGRPVFNRRQHSDAASVRTVKPGDEQRGPKGGAPTKASAQQRASVRPPPPSSRYTTATVSDAANIAFEQFGDEPETRRGVAGATQGSSGFIDGSEGAGRSSLTLRPSMPSLHSSVSTATPSLRRPPFGGSIRRRSTRFVVDVGDRLELPPELPEMLDGTHCEDEICVRFGLSWPQLRRMLIQLGKAVQQHQKEKERAAARGESQQQQARSRRRESSNKRWSGYAAAGEDGDDWVPEAPAFATASGFGASAWGNVGANSVVAPAGSLATSLRSKRPSRGGGMTGSAPRGRGEAAMMASPSSFGPKSWNQSLDGLEIDDEDEELERSGELGAVVLLQL